MSQEKQTAEEVREDIIERTYHNINDEPDKSAIHIRIALNNYAVPFEKKLQQQAKEIEELTRSRDDVFHELEGYKEHNNQLAKEIERLKGDSKEVNDKEIDAFINNYINALPDGWNSRLDMILSMKNAMIEALSYKEKYLTNH